MKLQLTTGALLAAAVAAPQLAHAESKLYGQINSSVAHVDSTVAGNGTRFAAIAQDGQSGDNNASRIGVQGEKGQFFFAAELGLDTDGAGDATGLGSTRHAFVGFNTSMGTVVMGRTNTAYKLAGQRIDPFYDTGAANFVGGYAPEGGTYGLSNLINGWTNNTIAYLSPEVAGFTLNAGVYLQEALDEDHDFGGGIEYNWSNLTAGVQYLAIGADAAPGVVSGSGTIVDTALQATAHWAGNGWTAGASYELVELKNLNDERGYAQIAGTFDVTDSITAAASVGQVDQGGGEGLGYTVGAFAKLIEDFQVYALASYADLENNDDATTIVTLGVKYGFEI